GTRKKPSCARSSRPTSTATANCARRASTESPSASARVAEATRAALGRGEDLDDLQLDLHHRHDYQLGDALARLYGERLAAAVPARDHQLSLVVGVDQADEIPEHDTVTM